jgi:hypothetical protein
VLDLTPQLIAAFGPNRERLYANCAALDYLATEIHPEDLERPKVYTDRALSNGTAYELERVRKYEGSDPWFLARYNPMHDDKGQIIRWYVAYPDTEDRFTT